jgi:hypothetical protein
VISFLLLFFLQMFKSSQKVVFGIIIPFCSFLLFVIMTVFGGGDKK